jgi:hypothetical protein
MFVAIRVHMAFTDGHPRNEPTNSIYYAYIENNHLYRGQYSYTMPGVYFMKSFSAYTIHTIKTEFGQT